MRATTRAALDTGDLPDISGFDCDVELTVTGDVTGDLGTGTAVTNDAGGPKAFYQALGEDLLLSAYSEGEGIEPTSSSRPDPRRTATPAPPASTSRRTAAASPWTPRCS